MWKLFRDLAGFYNSYDEFRELCTELRRKKHYKYLHFDAS